MFYLKQKKSDTTVFKHSLFFSEIDE